MFPLQPPGDEMTPRKAIQKNIVHTNPRGHRETMMPSDQHVDPDIVAGNIPGNIIAGKKSDAADSRTPAAEKFIDNQCDPDGFHPSRFFTQKCRKHLLHGLAEL